MLLQNLFVVYLNLQELFLCTACGSKTPTSEGGGVSFGSADVALKRETRRAKRSDGQTAELKRRLQVQS